MTAELPACAWRQLGFGSLLSSASARKTWHAHGIKSLCWLLMLDLFCKCLTVARWQDQHPAQPVVSLDAAKESVGASRMFATGAYGWLSCRHWRTDVPGESQTLVWELYCHMGANETFSSLIPGRGHHLQKESERKVHSSASFFTLPVTCLSSFKKKKPF